MSIRFEQVTKRFGDLTVLQDVNLTVARGEFAAIVGPSGCGKSTLLRMLAGLERPDAGQVLVDGRPVTGPGPERMMIFQEHALYPWRTVAENAGFGLEVAGVPRKERDQRVQDTLVKVGLSGFAGYYPHQLSGGMRQRASIARALVMDPEVLLLDEPYGALDAMTRLTMQTELLKLWQGSGKTVLLITHDIDEALTLADRVLVMSARPGTLVRELTLTEARPRNRSGAQLGALRQDVLELLQIA